MARPKSKEPISSKPIKTETAKAVRAYELYRDMGLDRSIREVATVLGISTTYVGRWSSCFNWTERVAEWDKAQDAARLKGAERAVTKAAEKVSFDRVVDLTQRRDKWFMERIENADLIERQGKYLVSFPAVTEERIHSDGVTKIVVTAADPRKHLAGARMIQIADEMKSAAYNSAFAAWVPRDMAPNLMMPSVNLPVTMLEVRLPSQRDPDRDDS